MPLRLSWCASLRPVLAGLAAIAIAVAVPQQSSPPAKTATTKAAAVPTFAKDVAPILYKRCVQCHRPGEVAPFSLIGYENAKKWSTMAAHVTAAKQMPPWPAEATGKYLDENRLTAAEIATLQRWAKTGAVRGDANLEPKPPTFKEGWPGGKPDLVVVAKQPVALGAEGDDEYRNIVVQTNFKETRYVSAFDCLPGNPKVVHHVALYVDDSGKAKQIDDRTPEEGFLTPGAFFTGFNPSSYPYAWFPGATFRPLPKGLVFELKPGATLVMQMHYHRSGKPQTDQTQIALYFSKQPPKQLAKSGLLADFSLKLPAGKKTTWERSVPVPADATMHALMPHMHFLGKSFKISLTRPDGSKEELVSVKRWQFNWQLTYWFKKPVKIPKGSVLTLRAVYDNTAANPRNPSSPPKDVGWGEQTFDEMFLILYTITPGFG